MHFRAVAQESVHVLAYDFLQVREVQLVLQIVKQEHEEGAAAGVALLLAHEAAHLEEEKPETSHAVHFVPLEAEVLADELGFLHVLLGLLVLKAHFDVHGGDIPPVSQEVRVEFHIEVALQSDVDDGYVAVFEELEGNEGLGSVFKLLLVLLELLT